MLRDPRLRLADIVQYADEAVAFVRGMTREEFGRDVRTQHAVKYALLVVGEATKHVPQALRDRRPGAAWKRAAGFRDHAAHGYETLDLDIIWALLHGPLRVYRDAVASLLAEVDAEAGDGGA